MQFLLLLLSFLFLTLSPIVAYDSPVESADSNYLEEENDVYLPREWVLILGGMMSILPCSLICLSIVVNCYGDFKQPEAQPLLYARLP